jgi:hypothetical protein
MTSLFRRLQPAKKFRISIAWIAKLLKIPKHMIVRVECWAYVSLLCHSPGRQSLETLSVNLLQAILLEKLGGCICC